MFCLTATWNKLTIMENKFALYKHIFLVLKNVKLKYINAIVTFVSPFKQELKKNHYQSGTTLLSSFIFFSVTFWLLHETYFLWIPSALTMHQVSLLLWFLCLRPGNKPLTTTVGPIYYNSCSFYIPNHHALEHIILSTLTYRIIYHLMTFLSWIPHKVLCTMPWCFCNRRNYASIND